MFMKSLLALVLTVTTLHVYAQQVVTGNSQTESNAVVLNNKAGKLPIGRLADLRIASVHFNSKYTAVFDSIAGKYWSVTPINGDSVKDVNAFNNLHDALKWYNLVLIQLSDETDFSPALSAFIADLESTTDVVVVLNGAGSLLQRFNGITCPLIWNKQNNAETASLAAQVIFGGQGSVTRLASDYGGAFKKGSGFTTRKSRLGYGVPSMAGVTSNLPAQIDAIVDSGIRAHAAPAVVILVAKNGEVIFSKAYGKHTYDGSEVTKADDIFDMASVTKVTATTPTVMRLYDRKLISLDSPISKYVAATRAIEDKRDVKIKEALLHEAGFTPYIKFYEKLKPADLSRDSSAAFPTKVADHYFLRANYFKEVMWPVTLASKGNTRGQYVYSDVSMYMMKEVVEAVMHRPLNEFVQDEFYKPLGMQSTGFLPRNRFDRSRIVPTTENDNWMRNMLVQGYVNDPGSAMAGGVEGHAGLFSTANDLAIYYQMLLNKGEYGGERYFSEATVDLFTSRQSKTPSARGYGFVRVTDKEAAANPLYPSQQAFGHTGYTGTYVWVDPKYNLVYICLTNRTYPDDGKTYGVSPINIRTRVLDQVYRDLLGEKK